MNTQDLFQQAKQDILKGGEQEAPVLYVEYTDTAGKECVAMFYFAGFGAETALTEKRQMFTLGMAFGQEHDDIFQVTQLAMIAEAWVAFVPKGKKRTWKRPQDAPNRYEALVMQLVEMQPTPSGGQEMKQSIKQAEIIRHGGTIDLGDVTEDLEIVALTLPGYFLAGYSASHMNDAQRQAIFKRRTNEVITTKLTTRKGTITHSGTSGFTVTAARKENHVETLIEYSDIAVEEMREMVGVLLTMLEELKGEAFVASCFARYAQETQKKFFQQEDGRKLILLRGKRSES